MSALPLPRRLARHAAGWYFPGNRSTQHGTWRRHRIHTRELSGPEYGQAALRHTSRQGIRRSPWRQLPQQARLDACLGYLREGDTLHVHSIDRLARNLLHLQQLVDSLTDRGISIVFHKENMRFAPKEQGAADPMSRLMMQMLGAFAEFERALIRERQKGRHQRREVLRKAPRPSEAHPGRDHRACTSGCGTGYPACQDS